MSCSVVLSIKRLITSEPGFSIFVETYRHVSVMEHLFAKMNPEQINVDRINHKYNAYHILAYYQEGLGKGIRMWLK